MVVNGVSRVEVPGDVSTGIQARVEEALWDYECTYVPFAGYEMFNFLNSNSQSQSWHSRRDLASRDTSGDRHAFKTNLKSRVAASDPGYQLKQYVHLDSRARIRW